MIIIVLNIKCMHLSVKDCMNAIVFPSASYKFFLFLQIPNKNVTVKNELASDKKYRHLHSFSSWCGQSKNNTFFNF